MSRQTSHSVSVSPELKQQVEKRCLAYVVAVGGATLLAAPARAEIVYTPTNVSVQNGTIFVDLNNDGISDFKLYDVCTDCSTSGSIKYLFVRGAQNPSARVVARKNGRFSHGTALPVPYGSSIGPNSPKGFIGPLRTASGPAMVNGRCFAGSPCLFYGPWQKATDKYLGIQFSISGQTHYGWARVTVKTSLLNRSVHIKATLTGYAYETQANMAIPAGDEGPKAKSTGSEISVHSPSLGLLSLGSAGLDAWRRERAL
jgi:hypothetical protein